MNLLQKFKETKFQDKLQSLTEPLRKISLNSKKTTSQTDETIFISNEFTFIYSRIFWMSYPTKDKIEELSKTLNKKFPRNNYYIWNVSEHKYDCSYFNHQVAEFSFVGYPCPQFQYLYVIVKSIMEWLNGDKNNVAIIHCQSTKGRSALIVSCLLSALKVVNHPLEALGYFCNKLHLDEKNILFPSQNLYMRHFANLMDNVHLNKKTFILQKVILNGVPKIVEENTDKNKTEKPEAGFRPYIQIFKGTQAVYNYITHEKPKTYYSADNVIWFDVGIELTEDILIRCRHYISTEERFSVFRIMFHPSFVFNDVVRYFKRDIDISPNIEVPDNFFIDLILQQTENENSEYHILEKLKEDTVKLSEDYQKNKDVFVIPAQKNDIKKQEEKKEEIETNPLEEVYEIGIKEEEPTKTELTPEKSEQYNKILNVVEADDENDKDETDESNLEDYLRKLEEEN